MKLARFGALALMAALLVSCNGSTSGGTGFAPLVGVNTSTTDPTGDTFTGATGTLWDILLVQTSRPTIAAANLQVTITLATAPVLPPPGGAGTNAQFGALLAFNTGASGGTTITCGPPLFTAYSGVNFNVLPFPRLADGNYQVVTSALAPTGEASVSVGSNSVIYTVPLSAIGGGSGATQMGVEVGNSGSGTDCAPNSGTITT